jgi:hypothetical protein
MEEEHNGTANGFHQQQLEGEDNFHSDWEFDEGHYYAEGDRHRLYERQKEEPKGKKPSKLPPMAGAFQKVAILFFIFLLIKNAKMLTYFYFKNAKLLIKFLF